jgi:complement component 1 Q subcomponent-binding protein, mitochondrial
MLDGPVPENTALDFHRELGDKFAASYEGPGIFELEEPFADPLFSFLEERGLSDDFAEFVALYAYHTEQREYINWLNKLSTFTA